MKKPKRARDFNSRAAQIVALAIHEVREQKTDDKRNPHAVALGRLGGLRGGQARARALTKEERIKIAKRAAKARWGRKKAVEPKKKARL